MRGLNSKVAIATDGGASGSAGPSPGGWPAKGPGWRWPISTTTARRGGGGRDHRSRRKRPGHLGRRERRRRRPAHGRLRRRSLRPGRRTPFNNAAALGNETVGHDGDLSELDVDTWDRTLAIPTCAGMLGGRNTVPHLVAAGGGAIVNIPRPPGAFQGTIRAVRLRRVQSRGDRVHPLCRRHVCRRSGALQRGGPGVHGQPGTPGAGDTRSAPHGARRAHAPRSGHAGRDASAAMAVFFGLPRCPADHRPSSAYVVDAGRLARRSTDSIGPPLATTPTQSGR